MADVYPNKHGVARLTNGDRLVLNSNAIIKAVVTNVSAADTVSLKMVAANGTASDILWSEVTAAAAHIADHDLAIQCQAGTATGLGILCAGAHITDAVLVYFEGPNG